MKTLSLTRILKIWIVFLCVLFAIAPTSTSLTLRLIGIIYIGVLFAPLFYLKSKTLYIQTAKYSSGFGFTLIILITQFLCTNYASIFYTGSGLQQAVFDLLTGANRYVQYQKHFKDEGLADFSLVKVPAILCLALMKAVFLYFFSSIFFSNASKNLKILMSISLIPIILMATARSTFFEIFEILVVILYGLYLGVTRIKIRVIIYLIMFSIGMLILFILNTMRRFEDTSSYFELSCITSMYCFVPYGINQNVEYVIYVLSSYFSMGSFFLAKYLSILFEGNLLTTWVPILSLDVVGLLEGGLQTNLCMNYVDCRAVWMPELISWISVFGVILVVPILWLFLVWINKIEYFFFRNNSLVTFPVLSLFLIYILSLPVGKFWSISSQNIICTVMFGLFFFLNYFLNRKN